MELFKAYLYMLGILCMFINLPSSRNYYLFIDVRTKYVYCYFGIDSVGATAVGWWRRSLWPNISLSHLAINYSSVMLFPWYRALPFSGILISHTKTLFSIEICAGSDIFHWFSKMISTLIRNVCLSQFLPMLFFVSIFSQSNVRFIILKWTSFANPKIDWKTDTNSSQRLNRHRLFAPLLREFHALGSSSTAGNVMFSHVFLT